MPGNNSSANRDIDVSETLANAALAFAINVGPIADALNGDLQARLRVGKLLEAALKMQGLKVERGNVMSGARAIYEERERQKHSEGWTPEHDAQHTDDSLAMAAVAYAAPERVYVMDADSEDIWFQFRDAWPESWDNAWDKRGQIDRRRSLVVAGALIAAEIDRIDHAARNAERKTDG